MVSPGSPEIGPLESVCGIGYSDFRTVNPVNADRTRHRGPALRVIHEPFPLERVPDHKWIGSAVPYRIIKQRGRRAGDLDAVSAWLSGSHFCNSWKKYQSRKQGDGY